MHLPPGEANRVYPGTKKHISPLVIDLVGGLTNPKAFPVYFSISLALQRKEKIHIFQYTHYIKFLQEVFVCTDKQAYLSSSSVCLILAYALARGRVRSRPLAFSAVCRVMQQLNHAALTWINIAVNQNYFIYCLY